VWRRITHVHSVAAHSFQHHAVWGRTPRAFLEDIVATKAALEDATARPVVAYRAPYFSVDGCDPWFGEALAEAGYRIDSSVRLSTPPTGFAGTLPLAGGGGMVTEMPLQSIGRGRTRVTVIGGTYFRLFPLKLIQHLLRRAERAGFIPMIYIHPYDLDPDAPLLDFPPGARHLMHRLGDRFRHVGRESAVDKLRALSQSFEFRTLESFLMQEAAH
jgi:peptidoglycan/xylan/chitin deacetylase (PgdA/CDA1 family)